MKTIKLLLIFVSAAMVAWSCSTSASPDDNWNPKNLPYAEAKRAPVATDSLMGIAQKAPGFGGLFINKSDQLAIYLTNPANQKEKAKEVLSNSKLIMDMLSQLQDQGYSVSVATMEILNGQFTFMQLHNWKSEVSSKILSMDGVYVSGIDQSRNKVSVGVKNKSVRDAALRKLSDLNIPEAAVIFYQMTPPELY